MKELRSLMQLRLISKSDGMFLIHDVEDFGDVLIFEKNRLLFRQTPLCQGVGK